MRDTLCLRARIALLACVPGLAGCSTPSAPEQVDGKGDRVAEAGDQDGKASRHGPLRDAKARREARKAAAEAKAEAKAAAEDEAQEAAEVQAPVGEPPMPTEGAPTPPGTHAGEAMIGYPGDPPFIDGYNPEEATCVSGNWCGTKAAAAAVAVPGTPAALECAGRISGGKGAEAIKADPKAYEGLSPAPNMQGALNQHGTELARAKAGGEDTCCYHWFEYCSGRPLLCEHGPVVAPARVSPRAAWSEPALAGVEPPPLAAALRQRIAEGWLEDALAEHASVAAFARATLELMAVGAPPSLLADTQRAALDEIEHTRLCASLAARYGGVAMEPGPLPAPAPRPASLARVAADAFAEGCVGETIAALAAQRAARGVADPTLKERLATLADDEARHAALAWSTVAWALSQGGEAVAERLREVAAALQPSPRPALPAADPHAATLAAHGRLDARAHALAAQEAWSEIIAPMLTQLLLA
jgi:hypothetical protein